MVHLSLALTWVSQPIWCHKGCVFTQAAQLLAKDLIWLVKRHTGGKRSELGCLCKHRPSVSQYEGHGIPIQITLAELRKASLIWLVALDNVMYEKGVFIVSCCWYSGKCTCSDLVMDGLDNSLDPRPGVGPLLARCRPVDLCSNSIWSWSSQGVL